MTKHRRPKVLMVEHHSPGNRYVMEFARELKNYCDLTIYCNKHAEYEEDGLSWIPGFYDGGKGKAGAVLDYGKTLLDLMAVIKKGRYDILHIQSFKRASSEMRLYASMRGFYRKLVMTVHNVLPHEPQPGDLALYGAFYKTCDLLIVHNDASKQELLDRFAIPDEKIMVIPRGLYTTYSTDCGRDEDLRMHFLCFGRIRPYKGVDLLLKAISLMTPQERRKCLFIIRGEQYQKLDPNDYGAMIEEYGIADCVEFSNRRVPEEEIPALWGNADAALFPYRKIYGSGVLLMAYTYQVPIIASDVPTFVEGTDNGQTGLLFASENPEALKEAILDALCWDEKKIADCKAAIRRIVHERHSWKATAKSTVRGYITILRKNVSMPDGGAYIKRINHLLQTCADECYDRFFEQGHASPGRNGPYDAKDTPVRNTAHWLITYAYLWKSTGEERYCRIALQFADYIVDVQSKSRSGAVTCMEEGGADHLNGLIGQAWAIEALVYAYKTFAVKEYINCAVSIFKSQQFDKKTGLWKRVEPDGTVIGYDFTLNHQVWFGMAGLLLLSCIEDRGIERMVDLHFKRVREEYFGIHPNGLIRHYGSMRRPRLPLNVLYMKQYIKYAGLGLRVFDPEKTDILRQEEGYHIFELFGYAHVAILNKKEPLFRTRAFRKAVDHALRIDALNERLGTDHPESMNKYAYGYNPPAFEWPFVKWVFGRVPDTKKADALLDLQMELTFDELTGRFEKHTQDPETLMARLYEYVCFCDYVKETASHGKETKKKA